MNRVDVVDLVVDLVDVDLDVDLVDVDLDDQSMIFAYRGRTYTLWTDLTRTDLNIVDGLNRKTCTTSPSSSSSFPSSDESASEDP